LFLLRKASFSSPHWPDNYRRKVSRAVLALIIFCSMGWVRSFPRGKTTCCWRLIPK